MLIPITPIKKRNAEPSLSAPATSAKRHIRTAPLAGAPFWNAVSGAASDVQESDKDSGLRFCRKQQSSTLSRRFKLYVILPHFPLVASVVRPRWTGSAAPRSPTCSHPLRWRCSEMQSDAAMTLAWPARGCDASRRWQSRIAALSQRLFAPPSH